MNKILFAIASILVGATLVAADADAARLGGGRSSGIQRNYTPPPARQAPAVKPQSPATAPATAPASGLSRWMPMLGGLAIGGLLGSMFGSGLGGAIGGILLMALLAFAVFALVRMLMRSRAPAAAPMQYSGLGNEPSRVPYQAPESAAPSLAPAPANIPAGFDADGFLRAAKMNFIKLQVANDSGDLEAIREVVTPVMFDELGKDIRVRGSQRQTTDVVSVDADLLDVATEGATHFASVRFSGLVREEPGTAPMRFSEVWHLAKPADGSTGWLLAGIQQQSEG